MTRTTLVAIVVAALVLVPVTHGVVTDFYGHKIPVGPEPETEYLLYSNLDNTETIHFTTSSVASKDKTYFIQSVRIARDNCGTTTISVLNNEGGSTYEASSECSEGRLSHSDNGIIAAAVGVGDSVAVFVPHHEIGKTYSFMNVRIAGDWEVLREEGCSGILCEESHGEFQL